MMTERVPDHQDSLEAVSRDNAEVSFTSGMEEIEESGEKIAEDSKNTEESTESWREDVPDVSMDDVSAVLSTQEAAPSVNPERKSELLLQARADRISWVQAVPLPYERNSVSADINDPWTQNDCLALLKDSNALQSLPCIPQVLSSLYGVEQGVTTDMTERIRTKLAPLGLNREECQLATTLFTKQCLTSELSKAKDTQQQRLLENYHMLTTKLQTPECASLVQGMRRFIRIMPDTGEKMASSLQSYLASTFESIKVHAAWKSYPVDDGLKHALESFIFGHCRDQVKSTLENEIEQDKELLDRLASLQFVTPSHLEVAFFEGVAAADELLKDCITVLLSVDSYFSPYEKLQGILKVYHNVNTALSQALNKDGGSRLPSADDVLPTLILVILRAKPSGIISNLRMIEVFSPPEYLRGEGGYAYTNLCGAVQFLRDLNTDNPESLSINADDFRRGLEESRTAAKAHSTQVGANEHAEESKKEVMLTAPVEIPVRGVRAARLRGETVDLEFARQWLAKHGAESKEIASDSTARLDTVDTLPESLPSGFSRTYSYMVTRPEDIRMTDLPQLLSEYRMLVHATEQLLGERTSRLAAERKQRYALTRSTLLSRAAEVNLPTKTKKDLG